MIRPKPHWHGIDWDMDPTIVTSYQLSTVAGPVRVRLAGRLLTSIEVGGKPVRSEETPMPPALEMLLGPYRVPRTAAGTPATDASQLVEILDGYEISRDRLAKAPGLAVSLSQVSEFQRRVLAATLQVRWGETCTYAELAATVGVPRGARAVGQALASNPFPLIIPCHRVISAAGRTTGYSAGGVLVKEALLSRERQPDLLAASR
jgi:O-6-methylguanine DNA methyltransferase